MPFLYNVYKEYGAFCLRYIKQLLREIDRVVGELFSSASAFLLDMVTEIVARVNDTFGLTQSNGRNDTLPHIAEGA